MIFPQRIQPEPGQESVWDYPRPPRIEQSNQRIQVIFRDVTIAESVRSQRILETSHPPVYYIPPEDVDMSYIQPSNHQSYCEWKGIAQYYAIAVGEEKSINAAWYYPNPTDYFAVLKNYLAFYPSSLSELDSTGNYKITDNMPSEWYHWYLVSSFIKKCRSFKFG